MNVKYILNILFVYGENVQNIHWTFLEKCGEPFLKCNLNNFSIHDEHFLYTMNIFSMYIAHFFTAVNCFLMQSEQFFHTRWTFLCTQRTFFQCTLHIFSLRWTYFEKCAKSEKTWIHKRLFLNFKHFSKIYSEHFWTFL